MVGLQNDKPMCLFQSPMNFVTSEGLALSHWLKFSLPILIGQSIFSTTNDLFLFSLNHVIYKITLSLCDCKLYSGILARIVSLLGYPTSSFLMPCSLLLELITKLFSDFHHISGSQPNLGKSVCFLSAAVNFCKGGATNNYFFVFLRLPFLSGTLVSPLFLLIEKFVVQQVVVL